MNDSEAAEIYDAAVRRGYDALHMLASLEPGAAEAIASMDDEESAVLDMGMRMGITGLILELKSRGILNDA